MLTAMSFSRTSLLLSAIAAAAVVIACSESSTTPTGQTSTSKTDAGDDDAGPDPESDASSATTVTVRAEDYDQECTTADQCVAVFSGNACAPCQCPNDAVAKAVSGDYAKALATAKSSCGDRGDVACAPCEPADAVCDPGTKRCALRLGVADGG